MIIAAIIAFVVTIAMGFGAMHLAELQRARLGRVGTFAIKAVVYVMMIVVITFIGLWALAMAILPETIR